MQLDAIGKKDLEVLKNWEFIQFNQDAVFGASVKLFKWGNGLDRGWKWSVLVLFSV